MARARGTGAAVALVGASMVVWSALASVDASASASQSAAGGNNNKGDVWLDTVTAPPGPGHEMDPHLPCADIILWGDKLADSGGSFTIDGWPPSGSQEQDYPPSSSSAEPWKYNSVTGGSQDLLTNSPNTVATGPGGEAAIPVKLLIDTARAHGDTPQAQQGFHFKLQFSQDPQKHKTFWVECQTKAEAVTSSSVTTETTVRSSTKTEEETTTESSTTTTESSTTEQTGGVSGLSTAVTSTKSPSGSVAGIATTPPNTGTPVPFIAGLILVLAGGACAGAASWRQRHRRSA